MNILPASTAHLAETFRLLGQPVRIQILLIIAREEACVCHIEAVLGIRQSSISQHLMVLRDAGMVMTSREGRNIFYRLVNPEIIDSIYHFASISGLSSEELVRLSKRPLLNCPCPYCNPEMDPNLSCQKIRK